MAANDQNRGTLLCILHALMKITPIATYLFRSSLVDIKALVSILLSAVMHCSCECRVIERC